VHSFPVAEAKEKADVVKRAQAFGYVGLLADGSAGIAGLPFI